MYILMNGPKAGSCHALNFFSPPPLSCILAQSGPKTSRERQPRRCHFQRPDRRSGLSVVSNSIAHFTFRRVACLAPVLCRACHSTAYSAHSKSLPYLFSEDRPFDPQRQSAAIQVLDPSAVLSEIKYSWAITLSSKSRGLTLYHCGSATRADSAASIRGSRL